MTYPADHFKSLTKEQKQIRYEKYKKYCDTNREAVRGRGRSYYQKQRKRKAESLMRYHNNQKAKQKLIEELQLQIQSINEEN